jgi:importin-9
MSLSEGRPGRIHVLECLARLLDPSTPSEATLFTGRLVTAVVERWLASGVLDVETLGGILRLVVLRLAQPGVTCEIVQRFVLVLARLVHRDPSALCDWLSNIKAGDNTALHIILRVWTHHQRVFRGTYTVKVTLLALAKLATLAHRGLEGVTVPGDVVETVVGGSGLRGPMTRSQRGKVVRSRPEVPFVVRVCAVLARALDRDEPEYHDDEDEEEEEEEDDEEDAWAVSACVRACV